MSYAHILGTMYEHSSYYDKGFIIDELMLYHIIYDLYHDPYREGGRGTYQACLPAKTSKCWWWNSSVVEKMYPALQLIN